MGGLCVVAIGFGLLSRGELDLSPADGLGYALGITGLTMMVVLLGYSLRKRMRGLRNRGSMRNWFEAHLILGLLGPTVILYHANFGLGSANATISLACVLAVSSSGVGGRFLYGRMHRSMAGERRSAGGIRKQAQQALVPIASLVANHAEIARLLEDFERLAIQRASLLVQLFWALGLRPRAFARRARILRLMQKADLQGGDQEQAARAISENLFQLCRVGELHLFEQLFALWHAIHIPLTVILFVSAAIHVIAVHLF